LIYLPILNLKSALLQSRSACRAVCLQDPRSSLREGRGFIRHSDYVIVQSEVSTNLDSSDRDYEYEHEQEPTTHLRIMIRQFVS